MDTLNPVPGNFICWYCNQGLRDKAQLKVHIQIEHGQLAFGKSEWYGCQCCSQVYSRQQDIMKHMRTVHGQSIDPKDYLINSTFHCPNCGVLDFKSMEEHVCHSIRNNILPCDICGERFSSEAHSTHKHTVIPPEGEDIIFKVNCSFTSVEGQVTFKCPVCENEKKSFSSLKEHVISSHGGTKKFNCVVCGASYALKKRLREHCLRKHTVLIQTKLAEDKYIPSHDETKDCAKIVDEYGNVKYKCHLCSRLFSMYSGLMRHVKSLACNAYVDVYCTYCRKSFSNKVKLDQHYRNIHGVQMRADEVADMKQQYGITVEGVTNYKCPHCTSFFPKFYYLRKHLRSHSDVRPYTCHVCGKSFSQQQSLNRHINIHSGHGYQCNVCGCVMSDKANLNVHMRNHLGEKKYICEVCGKAFAQWSSHYYHMFTHSDSKRFHCIICEKKFQSPAGLREHKRIHVISEERHVCETCGNSFSSRKNLLSHIKIHSTDRCHKCEYCPAAFVRRKYLVQHYKTHKSNINDVN